MIYGLGIYNMKGALVCYTQAVKALQRAGVKIDGSIMIAAVAGEIEKTQWGDEFTGKQYRGYGYGSHYMVCHGIAPDMCILGEPTDMHLVLGHYGSFWVRISTQGPYVHTAFGRGRERENSIRRMHDVLDLIYEWIPKWETEASYCGQKGIVNVGGIHGGHAWRASRTPERTDVYLDMRVPPTILMQRARHAAKDLFLELQKKFPAYGLDFETYVSVPGAEISENHRIGEDNRSVAPARHGRAREARHCLVVLGCLGDDALRNRNAELWAFERAARRGRRKSGDQDVCGYYKDLCAGRRRDLRSELEETGIRHKNSASGYPASHQGLKPTLWRTCNVGAEAPTP